MNNREIRKAMREIKKQTGIRPNTVSFPAGMSLRDRSWRERLFTRPWRPWVRTFATGGIVNPQTINNNPIGSITSNSITSNQVTISSFALSNKVVFDRALIEINCGGVSSDKSGVQYICPKHGTIAAPLAIIDAQGHKRLFCMECMSDFFNKSIGHVCRWEDELTKHDFEDED